MARLVGYMRKLDKKSLVWTLCVAALCIIDVIRHDGTGAQWALANAFIGVAMFPLIVLRFKFIDFLKLPYIIWLVVMAVVGPFIFRYISTETDYDASKIVGIIVFALYGLVAIRLLSYLFFESKEGIRVPQGIVFGLWFIMMVMCIASKEKSLWPLWFLIMFGAFYLAPLNNDDLSQIILSVVDGIILSFFLIQSYAFLHRPFDYYVRYRGSYTNCNNNAMFYLMVFAAWLVKISYTKRKKERRIKYYFVFFFASAMCSFIMLTLSRSAVLVAIVVAVVYWLVEELLVSRNGIGSFLKKGFLMVLTFMVSFPLVFACVRYLPGLRHHPVWFPTDEYSPDLVHSYTPINSPSYIDIDEWFNGLIWRSHEKASDSAKIEAKPNESITNVEEGYGENLQEFSAEKISAVTVNEKVVSYSDGIKPGTDGNHPAFTEVKYSGISRVIGIRKYIFWYVFDNLHILGNSNNFPIQITPWFKAFHAHNSFLQIAYLNGFVAGMSYFILSFGSGLYLLVMYKKVGKDLPWYYLFTLLYSVVVTLEGLTECTSHVGKMLFLLSFIMLLPLIRGEKVEETLSEKENIG